jgi:hypothetical protein
MSKRFIRLAMASAALAAAANVAAAQTPGADRPDGHYHIFMTGKARMTVLDALDGAARRLTTPVCRQIFDDFADANGRPLADDLAARARSASDVLAALYFVDGDETAQCRGSETIAAFTEPGSRVVRVCSKRFVQFAAKTTAGEILLIHELLHSLGLGENPPTSAEITNAVARRCR